MDKNFLNSIYNYLIIKGIEQVSGLPVEAVKFYLLTPVSIRLGNGLLETRDVAGNFKGLKPWAVRRNCIL